MRLRNCSCPPQGGNAIRRYRPVLIPDGYRGSRQIQFFPSVAARASHLVPSSTPPASFTAALLLGSSPDKASLNISDPFNPTRRDGIRAHTPAGDFGRRGPDHAEIGAEKPGQVLRMGCVDL